MQSFLISTKRRLTHVLQDYQYAYAGWDDNGNDIFRIYCTQEDLLMLKLKFPIIKIMSKESCTQS